MALVYDVEPVFGFVRGRLPGMRFVEGMTGMGLTRNGAMVAGVLFEGFNSHNIWAHIAAEPGGRWLTRTFLKAMFAYPFKVCGCEWLRGYVDASNLAARRFDEHLGFKQEAQLTGAAQDGGDVIVYAMRRSECRFLES
jgi:RimJ/RimL family protein N-acetyltransferase